ncbi:Protein ARV 1 [Linum perenne]
MLRLFGQRLVIVRITNLVPTELRIGWPSSFYGWVLDCFGSFILVVRTGEATEIVQRPAATTAMGYRCVECGFPITILYVQYSPGNIRLIKCENCKAVADGYIECEFMVTMDFLVGNSLFLCVFLLATRIMLNSSLTFSRLCFLHDHKTFTTLSFLLNIYLQVWEFPPSVIYIIDIFVLSSNMVALKG